MEINSKIIVTFSYMDYKLLKNKNLKGFKIVYISNPFFLKLNIEYKNLKINNFKLKPKRYKLDNIFSQLLGFKEFYILINNKEDNFLGYSLKKFILKFINKNAIVLGIKYNNFDQNINNSINNSFDFDRENFQKIMLKKIKEKFESLFISYINSKITGKYIYINNKTLKILNYLKNNTPQSTNKWTFIKINNKTKIEKELDITLDTVYSILKITYPFLNKKQVFNLVNKIITKEKFNKYNNGVYLPIEYINENKYKSKNRFIVKILNILKLLYLNKENIELYNLEIMYKNNKKETKILNYTSIVFLDNSIDELLNKLNLNMYEINFVINKKYINNIIKEKKDFISIEKVFNINTDFNTLIGSLEYLSKKRILYTNGIVFKINKSANIILDNISKINLEIKNTENNIIQSINNIILDNKKLLETILDQPSLKQLKKIKQLNNLRIIKIDENKKLTKKEADKILLDFYEKQNPSEKQINLIEKIFNENHDLTKNFNKETVLSNKNNVQKFLYQYFYNTPSKKQLELITNIEKKYNLKINDNIKNNKFNLKNYLKEFI